MQTMELASWSAFKTLVASKNLLIQYSQIDNYYNIYAPEASTFLWHYGMIMDGGSDQTDFETNYKPTANAPLEIRAAAGRPQRVSSSPQPDNTVEHWQGYQITVPIGQTSAYVDISFPNTVYIRGGWLYSADLNLNDYVSVDVLVAANNAEYLPGIISTAYLIPNTPVSFESDESLMLPTTLKLRATLTIGSISLTNVFNANILVDYFE